MTTMTKLFAAAALLTLSACTATSGYNFDWKDANSVRNGMTHQEVEKIMGAPPTATNGDGSVQKWVFAYANGLTGGWESKAVTFRFDPATGRTVGIGPNGVAPYINEDTDEDR